MCTMIVVWILAKQHIEINEQLDNIFVSAHIKGWAVPKNDTKVLLSGNFDHRLFYVAFNVFKIYSKLIHGIFGRHVAASCKCGSLKFAS